jgi:hypothetical protein
MFCNGEDEAELACNAMPLSPTPPQSHVAGARWLMVSLMHPPQAAVRSTRRYAALSV